MKAYVLTACFAIVLVFSYAQGFTILNEGFEGAFPSGLWTVRGNPTWDDHSGDKYSGSWAAWCAASSMNPSDNAYADNMNAGMTYGPFSLAGARNAKLSFWSKVNTEDEYDHFLVNVNYFQDGSWITRELHRRNGIDNSAWTMSEYSLNEYVGMEQVEIDFVFTSDGSVSAFNGVWVDDIIITKDDDSGLTPDPYEPNNVHTSATQLTITPTEQVTSLSLHSEEDFDWFVFDAQVGREYLIASMGMIDTMVELWDDQVQNVLTDNDDGGDNQNFSLSFYPPYDGRFRVKVKGYGGATGLYQLKYSHRQYEMGSPDAYEPNNYHAMATRINPSQTKQRLNLNLHHSGDVDWFIFRAELGKVYRFNSTGNIDTKVDLYAPDGVSMLDSNDDDGDDSNFLISFIPTEQGDYYLKVSGYSNDVGDYGLEYILEQFDPDSLEPNDNANQASNLTVTTTLQSKNLSFHNASDEDFFKFNATRGRVYTFYSEGSMDTEAYLYATDKTTELLMDDDSGENSNFRIEFYPGNDGTYYLKVKPYSQTVGNYSLHYVYETATGDSYEIDNTPAQAKVVQVTERETTQSRTLHYARDIDWVKFRGEAGRTYIFHSSGDMDMVGAVYEIDGTTELLTNDDGGENQNFRLEFYASETRDYLVRIAGYTSVRGEYNLHYISRLDVGDEYEPNNTPAQAKILRMSFDLQNQSHTIHTPLDVDWFKFRLEAGREYVFYSEGDFDVLAYLYESNGTTMITEDDDSGGDRQFRIAYTPSRTADYLLKVAGYSGATGNYRLFYK